MDEYVRIPKQTYQRLRLIFENVSEGISIYEEFPETRGRRLLECNEHYAEMSGKSQEELLEIGDTTSIQKSLDVDADRGSFLRAIQEDKRYRGLFSWIRPDGRENVIEYNAVPILVDGRVFVVGLDRDITEQLRAESALQASRERYRRITGAITDYIYTVRIQDGQPVETTHGPACVAVTGYAADEFEANPYLWIDVVSEEDRETVRRRADHRATDARWEPLEHRIVRKDGAVRWVRNTPVPHYDGQGKLVSYDGLIRDITERKSAELALQRKTRQQEKLIETARQLTASLDVTEVLTRIGIGAKEILNAFSCAIYLLDPDGKTLTPVVALEPLYADQIMSTPLKVEGSFTGQAIVAGHGLIFNDAGTDYSGQQIPRTPPREKEYIIAAPFVADDSVLGAMCLNRVQDRFSEQDLALAEIFCAYAATALKNARAHRALQHEVEERRRTEAALMQSEERYRTTIDAMGDLVHVVDRDLRIVLCNQSFRKRLVELGYDVDPLGKYIWDVFPFLPPQVHSEYRHVLESGEPWLTEELTEIGQGEFWSETAKTPILDGDGSVYRIVTIVRDITEPRKAERDKQELESKLERARLMESLGVLAGGVAHDLNNLLGPLVAYPDLILMDLPEYGSLREDMLLIKEAADKAASVVQDLLAMARRGAYRMSPQDLNALVREHLRSPFFSDLQARNPGVSVEGDLDRDLLYLSGSAPHLSKVIMNLVTNAFEAMPGAGVLTISTFCTSLDRPLDAYEHVEAGDYVVLCVRDTGVGIAERDLARIFEPFYTKKEMGRSGSGLGLSVVEGVVQDHKGRIDLQSTVGAGTTFTVYFPVTHEVLLETSEQDEDYFGRESVLVIDDLGTQRDLAVRLLSLLGYNVTAVASGRAALDYLRETEVDILVLDMIMEDDFDGLETYRQIAEIRPGQKAVIASGFTETERVKEAQRLGAGQFVKKPYTLRLLGSAIRQELDKGE